MTVVPETSASMHQYELPKWAEYVSGGLLVEQEADVFQSLHSQPIIESDDRISVISCVLSKQVSQEISRFLLDALRAADSLKMPANEGKILMDAMCRITERFDGGPLHIDGLFIMSRIVRENVGKVESSLFFSICRQTLQSMTAEVCIEVMAAISLTLEEQSIRIAFSRNDRLLDVIFMALQKISNQPQLHYNVLLCLWLVSFDRLATKELLSRCNIIPKTVVICRSTSKEKVIRVGVGLWRNLLERNKEDVLPILIGSRTIDFIGNCVKKNFDDPDLKFDLQFVAAELEAAILKLTTFDEYASEVKSGNLDWTPPHKSALFWKDNAARMHDHNADLLRYDAFTDTILAI